MPLRVGSQQTLPKTDTFKKKKKRKEKKASEQAYHQEIGQKILEEIAEKINRLLWGSRTGPWEGIVVSQN